MRDRHRPLSFNHLLDEPETPKIEFSGVESQPEKSRRVLTFADIKAKERDNVIAALVQCGWKIGGSDGAGNLYVIISKSTNNYQ